MKYIVGILFILSVVLSACTPAAEVSPTMTPLARWPEHFAFCRPKNDGSGTSDCVQISSDAEWLALNPVAGERLVPWPEGMDLPPLPEDLAWEYKLDTSIGEYIWTIVEAE